MTSNEANKILDELKKLGYLNKLITYSEFKKIYEHYKINLTETKFANMLGIPKRNFFAMKNGGKTRIMPTKKRDISYAEKEKIRAELIKNNYKNKLINYEIFKNLYKEFGNNMIEVQFAEIIGIQENTYKDMKNNRANAYILKYSDNELEAKRKEIKEELEKEGYINSYIDYEEFKRIYQKYGSGLSETKFANLIGIESANYWCMKNRKTRAKVLKTKLEDISNTKKQIIINKIRQKNHKLISYQEFKELYKEYGSNFTEVQMAELLGISQDNYYKIKNTKQRAQIDLNRKQRLKVKNQCNESRFYSKEEINKLIEQQDITLNEFISFAFDIKSTSEMIEEYKKVLEGKGKLYIGKTIINKEFMNKNAGKMLDTVRMQSKVYGAKYGMIRFHEDIASDVILLIMEKYGEIAYNFEEEKALEILQKLSNKAIKYEYFHKMKIRPHKSLDEKIENKDGKRYTNYKILEDKDVNVEKDIDDDFEL